MNNQLFVCTYNSQEAFDISKQKGLLGFSTKNAGTIGSLGKISSGDLILLRDSRNKGGLAFFGLLEATDKIHEVNSTAPLIWSAEQEANKVIFTHRLPVRFLRKVSRFISTAEALSWKWKKRYPPFNEYNWTGYSKLFSGNFLDETQKNILLAVLEINKPEASTAQASDLETTNEPPEKVLMETYRILRDTALARKIKEIHNHVCQICGLEPIQLPSGNFYAEAHHIMPLGKHHGLDVEGNIICVCPNCHAKLDYGVISLQIEVLQTHITHTVEKRFVEYHNKEIYNRTSK
jgi:hypothetical protein